MSDDGQLSISELRRRRAQTAGAAAGTTLARVEPALIETVPRPLSTMPSARTSAPQSPPPAADKGGQPSFDRSRFIEALRRRWHWLALAALVSASLGGAIGYALPKYTLLVTLTLRDLTPRFSGADGVSYKPPQLSSQTLVNFLSSPELLSFAGAQANPALSERQFARVIEVVQEKNSETIGVTFTGRDPAALVALANLYTAAAVSRSQAAQVENPSLMYDNFTRQLAEIDKQRDEVSRKLTVFRTNSGVTDPALEHPAYEKEWVDLRVQIDVARGQLDLLDRKARLPQAEPIQRRLQEANTQLLIYQSQGKTEEHPDIKRLRSEIAQLTLQLTEPQNGTAANLPPAMAMERKSKEMEIAQLEAQAAAVKAKLDKLYENTGEYMQLKTELDRLDSYQQTLNTRRFEARQYRDNAQGYYKPPAEPAGSKDVDTQVHYTQTAAAAARGGMAGLAAAMLLVMLLEYADPRLKTAADVKRVTGLPLLAALGDLSGMDEAVRKAWAFRNWTILSNAINPSGEHGAVCGLISCAHGEGRSTWVELLVGAARERGLDVIKLDFGHDAGPADTTSGATAGEAADIAASAPATILPRDQSQLAVRSNGNSVVHIQLPGLVWDLERRSQFQHELQQWRAMSRSVVLVDLPPACVPEAILLAENLPQLIWLSDAGKSHARETRMHLETLRHARCKLIGAVLNHEPEPLIKL